jgi:asparagine synthase (glutamine-hydrolysing)
MCGIAGFFDLRKKLEKETLFQMNTCQRHRGPDGDGVFFHSSDAYNLGLAHKRLSIIDLSVEANQPFFSKDGRYVMVFNGEMYNFKEVAAKYGISPRTSSDTEILLEAFAQKGIECIHDFNGMFAIAIWDTQTEQLYLIRDRFGVKPIVYYEQDGLIAFASELKTILSLPIKKELNLEALQDYLFLEYVPSSASIIKNCHKLPNGHYMTVGKNGISVKPYYQFKDKIAPRPLAHVPEDKALNELEELLSSAVQYRQVSDVPIGAFLSGGTDSSLICSLFQKQNSEPIQTFTIGFDVASFDETKYASAVAQLLHTNHKEFRISDKDSLSIVERLVSYYDEPFAAPSTIPSYLVCHEARKVVTVAMSGDGGDELFMGYGYYPLYARLKKLYSAVPGIGRKVMKNAFHYMGERYQRASRTLDLPSKNLFVHLWAEQQFMFTEKEIGSLTKTNYKNRTLAAAWEKADALPLNDFEKISLVDIEEYLTHNLLYKMDSASMANSLEVRNPFLDYRLMEYSFNLPVEYKIREGEQKYLMKKLLERYIPKDLIYRQKWGFPAPVGNWLQTELSYLIDKWLNKDFIKRQEIFNEQMIERYVLDFRSGKNYHYKRIWSLIVFQMWHEKYLGANVN